jgi:hypothetical protein
VAKFGIALEWGSRGRWFESSHSDHIFERPSTFVDGLLFLLEDDIAIPVGVGSVKDFSQIGLRTLWYMKSVSNGDVFRLRLITGRGVPLFMV